MNRSMRLLSCCLLFLLLALPVAGIAGGKTLGVVITGKVAYFSEIHAAFMDELKKNGFYDEQGLEVLVQKPAPDLMAWHNSIRKLLIYDVNLIVTYGGAATATALEETSKIPVVYGAVFDPRALGVIKNNSAGVSSRVPITTIIENLKRITDLKKLGVIYNRDEVETLVQTKEIAGLEGKLGFSSVLFDIHDSGSAANIEGVDALLLTASCACTETIGSVVSAARDMKIPTAAVSGGNAERGVILTSSADAEEQGRLMAEAAKKILTGTAPSGIGVKDPKKLNLIINLKEAKELGVKIPFDMLVSATKVIK